MDIVFRLKTKWKFSINLLYANNPKPRAKNVKTLILNDFLLLLGNGIKCFLFSCVRPLLSPLLPLIIMYCGFLEARENTLPVALLEWEVQAVPYTSVARENVVEVPE